MVLIAAVVATMAAATATAGFLEADARLLAEALQRVPSWLVPSQVLRDPAVAGAAGAAFVIACVTFLVGHAASNVSQVDKLWSILPPIQAVWYAYYSGWDPRCLLMAGLSVAWGIRLTFNFWMKGGYKFPQFWQGEQDYRWAYIQASFPGFKNPTIWALFHLLMICFFQITVIALFSSSSLAYFYRGTELNALDYTAAALFVTALAVETAADYQMFQFQTVKYALLGKGTPLHNLPPRYCLGFIHDGLFAYSRHPSYACEVTMWTCFFLFNVAASGQPINFCITGPLLLAGIFMCSYPLTEKISASKYPQYSYYCQQVPPLFPVPCCAADRAQWMPKMKHAAARVTHHAREYARAAQRVERLQSQAQLRARTRAERRRRRQNKSPSSLSPTLFESSDTDDS